MQECDSVDWMVNIQFSEVTRQPRIGCLPLGSIGGCEQFLRIFFISFLYFRMASQKNSLSRKNGPTYILWCFGSSAAMLACQRNSFVLYSCLSVLKIFH